jgi:hypothetical protein
MPVISTAIERTLTEAGIVFDQGDDEFMPGVRLRKQRSAKPAPPLAPEAPSQDKSQS